MAHFAELDENNIVLRVIVIDNENMLDANNQENENIGAQFCQNLLGGTWIQTSYNKTFRKNYASSGYTYDENLDAFVPPKPYNSWILNEETARWYPPIPKPTDGNEYIWNEETLSWMNI